MLLLLRLHDDMTMMTMQTYRITHMTTQSHTRTTNEGLSFTKRQNHTRRLNNQAAQNFSRDALPSKSEEMTVPS